jgi:hypothetical protein
MIIALRSIITSSNRQTTLSKTVLDDRSLAAAAVTSRSELLAEALALVMHACPDGAVAAAALRKLAFDDYVKKCNTESLVRLLELDSFAAVPTKEHIQCAASPPSSPTSGALRLCIDVLGNPDDLSNELIDPDVELVLIESVSATLCSVLLHVILTLVQVLGLCSHDLDPVAEAAWRSSLQSFRAWMRLPHDVKSPCRPFARRADLIITRLIMTHHLLPAHRIAAAVPTQVPEAIIVHLASRALCGLPQSLDSPCISLAPRTGVSATAVSSKNISESKALDRSPLDFAKRAGRMAQVFSFDVAPSAALCISILGILPPAAASKHAMEIASVHGSKLVYVVTVAV